MITFEGMPVVVSEYVPHMVWHPSQYHIPKKQRRRDLIIARRRGLPPPRYGRWDYGIMKINGSIYMHPDTLNAMRPIWSQT